MPRTRSLAWSELKIGIVAVTAVLLVIAIIFGVGGEGGFFWQRYPIKTRFNEVGGLKAGAVVRLSGKEIGAVTSVEFAGTQIELVMELSKDIRSLVTTESVAALGSLSLLGEPIVDIRPGQGGTPLADWAYIRAQQPGASIAEITATASLGIEETNKLIMDLRAGRGTMGKFLTDEALYAEMTQLVNSASEVTRAINRGQGTLGGLVKDPAAYEALKTSLENLQAVTARINSGQGALGRFVNDEAMGKSLSATMTNLETTTARLNRGEGTAGKLLTDQALYDKLNSMAGRVDQLMTGLESGRGTAGQLLHDKQLYENMNRTVTELRDLLAEIRKDPKKYLRVSVSIF